MKQETEVKTITENRIELLILHIAVKNKSVRLVEQIKEQIVEELAISQRYLTYIFENRSQASKAEMVAIAEILKTYLPEITLADLTDFGNENQEAGDTHQG
jgi:tricorn protease-like protein